jgi:hypothetical protein
VGRGNGKFLSQSKSIAWRDEHASAAPKNTNFGNDFRALLSIFSDILGRKEAERAAPPLGWREIF